MSKIQQRRQKQPFDCNGRQVGANLRSFSRPNPRGQFVVSTTSPRLLHSLVGRVSYLYIMSRLSTRYKENQSQTHQPPSLATISASRNLHTWPVGMSKYPVASARRSV